MNPSQSCKASECPVRHSLCAETCPRLSEDSCTQYFTNKYKSIFNTVLINFKFLFWESTTYINKKIMFCLGWNFKHELFAIPENHNTTSFQYSTLLPMGIFSYAILGLPTNRYSHLCSIVQIEKHFIYYELSFYFSLTYYYHNIILVFKK
jgi:hypothetical protein